MPPLPNGPRATPLLSLRFISDPIRTIASCARRYGDPFVLPSPGGALVTTGDPEGIRAIFSAPPDTFVPYNRDDLSPVLGQHSLFVQSGAEHKAARRLLMPPFHGARMRAYGEAVRAITVRWAGRLREGSPFVMEEATHEISLDVIIRAIFGITDPARAARFRDAFLEFSKPRWLFLFPGMRREFGGRGPWATLLRRRDGVHALIAEEIQRRRAQDPAEDILSLLLEARDDNGSPLGDRELREHLLTLVVAGHETTGTSLAWAFYWLHRHPDALARLRDELASLGEDPVAEAIAALPFLDAVCAETMRLFPLIPLVTRRLTLPFRLKGYELPAGTSVAAAASLVHYDPAVYPEPSRFLPERFLQRSYSPFEYIPFGGGARRCLGAAFALYEMKLVLATALSRLRLRLAKDAPVRARYRSVTLSPTGGIPMILEART